MIETSTLEGTLGGSAGDDTVARLLILALECMRPHAQAERFLLGATIRQVTVGRAPGRDHRVDKAQGSLRIDVPDRWMSSNHCTFEWARTHWCVVDNGSKNGTRVNGVRIEKVALKDGDLVEIGSTLFVYRDVLVTEEQLTQLSGTARGGPPAFRTLCPPLEAQLDVLRRVATADVSVMISGETGTGKELVAQAIHELSGRSGEFVAVNCGAIAPTLVESELFGHKKGAFSGATHDKPGLVRASDKGTLFLDEVAELPEQVQVALLRVLQEKEVRAVGDAYTTSVDLRVVTATHQDVAGLVDSGEFRADLYSRLAGFAITLPPLRHRREDMGLLISALLRRLAPDRAERMRVHTSAARALFDYPWPMNVRELEQSLRVALAVADGEELSVAHLPASVRGGNAAANDDTPGTNTDQRSRVLELMKKHKGNLSAVARELATSRAQVRRLAKRYDIDPESFR